MDWNKYIKIYKILLILEKEKKNSLPYELIGH